MERPIIFSIDDDPQVLRAVTRDLRTMYGKEYKIMSTTSAKEALESLIGPKKTVRMWWRCLCATSACPKWKERLFWKKL